MLKPNLGHFHFTLYIKVYVKCCIFRDGAKLSHIIMNHHKIWGNIWAVYCFYSPQTCRIDRDNPIMWNSHFPPHYIHNAGVGKCIQKNLLLFFGVCLSILELLGFKYCKWNIYICTVYNFQVHEKDFQRLILVMTKKILQLYTYIHRCIYPYL